MDEDRIHALASYLKSSNEPEPFETRLEEHKQAIAWAEKRQRWDLVIELAMPLLYRLAYSPLLSLKGKDEEALQLAENVWRQGRELSERGLNAARRLGDKDTAVQFLEDLARISLFLKDFSAILSYMKQWVTLATAEDKWGLAYELAKFGKLAKRPGHYSTATSLFQMSLDLWEELNDRPAMASALFHLGDIELEQGHLLAARQFFERSVVVGSQDHPLLMVVLSLEGLGKTYQREGNLDRAKDMFRRALSIADGLDRPAIEIVRKDLRELLGQ